MLLKQFSSVFSCPSINYVIKDATSFFYYHNVVHNLFTTNASIHDYNTRSKHKLRAAYGKHCFMYNNFRFVGTQIWNYIIDHLDIKVSLSKLKKIFKAHIQSNNYNFQLR